MFTCGIDDSLREVDLVENKYSSLDVRLGAQPRGMDVKDGTVIAATIKEVYWLNCQPICYEYIHSKNYS